MTWAIQSAALVSVHNESLNYKESAFVKSKYML